MNPSPGVEKPNVDVVFGVTPSNFENPDQDEEPHGMNVDLGNATFNGSFQDNKNQTLTTKYVTDGIYTIRVTAQLRHYLRANDWNCRYTCKAVATTRIRISPTGLATVKLWDESAEKKALETKTAAPVAQPSPNK